MAYEINELCVCCQKCVQECPADAISFDGNIEVVDTGKFTGCGVCAEVCNLGAAYDADNPAVPPEKHGLIELECDLVVLGGGGGGMVAAARTASLTGKKVIVLEKTKHIGGGAWFAAGGTGQFVMKKMLEQCRKEFHSQFSMSQFWRLQSKNPGRAQAATGTSLVLRDTPGTIMRIWKAL